MRKRVIKLLKSFYAVTEDRERQIDVCTRLVLRMLDEDDTVKDFAVKTVEELWFRDAESSAPSQRNRQQSGPGRNSEKSDLLAKVTVIMGVSANFKDRQSPVEDLLHQIMDGKDANEMSTLHARYVEICQTLIDGLVDASDLPGFVRPCSIDLIICVLTQNIDRSQLCANHPHIRVRLSCSVEHNECLDITALHEECDQRTYCAYHLSDVVTDTA